MMPIPRLLVNHVYQCTIPGCTFLYLVVKDVTDHSVEISVVIPPINSAYTEASKHWKRFHYRSNIVRHSTLICHIDDLPNHPEYLL